MGDRHARRLRKLANPDKGLRIQVYDALDQVIAGLGPRTRYRLVALVVRHGGSPGREDRHVRAALAYQLQLVQLEAFANLVVGNRPSRRQSLTCLECRKLFLAIGLVWRGRRGVMTVAVDDHPALSPGAASG